MKLAKPDFVMRCLQDQRRRSTGRSTCRNSVIVDPLAAELETCYAGAGTIRHLARFSTEDILRLNNATIATITSSSD